MAFPGPRTKPFPVADAVLSYWRKQVGPIDNHRSTEHLPARVDVVIVGAGYAGASIVHHIVEECVRSDRPIPSILILEAREACSGATGRNGGHLKPDPLSRAASVLETHGKAVAEHVATFEARQVDVIKELVQRENCDCDFEETRVTDVCFYKAGCEKIKADLAKIAKANISTAKGIEFTLGSEAEEVSGVRGAKSCHTYNAARLWPYRLVAHLLEKAVSMGVNLQTNTPVTSISAADEDIADHRWVVNTPRGSVKTSNLVYATNGYTSALVPEIKDKVVPVRGIVAHLTGKNAPKMTDSYMMRFSDYEYDYMIPRPDGSIIVGGGRRDYYKDLDEWFDVSDDSRLMNGARHYFDGYMQRHFRGWENSGARTEDLWTGIMGYSNDGFPYVGPVCGKPGQYMCAGFSGHGMPQIFLSAKAVASMVLTGNSEDVDLPVPYRITGSRWYQQKEHMSLKMWQQIATSQPAQARL
ncbi:fad dependent oxidoreductase [Stemphylium lycopersici]|uniref:Fad dependent oxidoreductase n=1 Tax=Stemphylium lycopersici TaxID=183478 RepID=A0A364N4U5_STELY|nr:fad dependent oxidoreductase [Stemphylium lycopersici]RAR11894.1 fad dependent oxidoreductase [Stemphylium lycopersici]RAR11955.1 fad dependent oxidoreductase [Stemphylium lycopersici]